MAWEGSLNRWLDEHEGADDMRLDIGGVRAGPPAALAAQPARPGGVPLRPRRRRRLEVGQELATPLAATFLGLLLVQNFLPAQAAGFGPGASDGTLPAGSNTSDGVFDNGATTASLALAQALSAAMPSVAATAGGAIDPAALTRLAALSGTNLVVGATATNAASGAGVVPAPPEAPAAWSSGLQGGMGLPELPQLAETTETTGTASEDEVGPIGRYVRGDGSDGKIVLTNGDDIFVGSDGNEHVVGGAGDDYLDGAGGDDHLEGGIGDDTLLGGSGNDLVEGGAGNDLLDGGIGDDRLLGGAGDDRLLGGGGDDFLNGGSGIDRLEGGTGNEILVLADVRDAVTELNLGIDQGGDDTLVVADSYGASLATALSGTGGRATFVLGRPDIAHFPDDVAGFRQQIDPDIENIRLEGRNAHDVVGDDHASLIIGNEGANRIHAGGGADSVLGGGGADWIDGGDGDDWLDGGLGGDTVYGGAGDDMFVFGLHEDGDLIFDHEGRNTLRIAGADPGKVQAGLRGDDLVVTHDGAVLATIDGYVGHADNYAGIDLGQGVRPISDFMADPGATVARAQSIPGDWLAGYVPEASALAEPLPEPWSGLEDQWAAAPANVAADLASVPGSADASGDSGFQPSFAALDASLGAADLWLPVDDMAGMPAETATLDRHGEERPASG